MPIREWLLANNLIAIASILAEGQALTMRGREGIVRIGSRVEFIERSE